MIEKDIEDILKTQIASVVSDCEIIGSWSHSVYGSVKGEHDKEAKAIVSVYTQPRQHDSFSLPTVNITTTIALDFRVERCPTMAEVAPTFEAVQNMLDQWHYDGSTFSNVFSTQDFYATELRLDGGDRVVFDQAAKCWRLSTIFTIRGTVNHT